MISTTMPCQLLLRRRQTFLGRRFLPTASPSIARRRRTFQQWSSRYLTGQTYARGPDEPPLLRQTIPENLASIVSRYGYSPALISRHQSQRLTYEELDNKSNALARGLAAQGVRKGDRVAVSLGNNIECALTTYGLCKLGAICVPLNPAFKANQVVSALNHIEASHIIIGTEVKQPRREPHSSIPLLSQIIGDLHKSSIDTELVPSLKGVVRVSNDEGMIDTSPYPCLVPFEDLVSGIPNDQRPLADQHLDPDDIINIQFTSGTTSKAKAACLTHTSLLNNAVQIGDRMQLTPQDIVCSPPPLFHCFGCVIGYLASATHASSHVLPGECFDPRATLNSIRDEHCTALHSVPTMFVQMLDLIESGGYSPENFKTLRTGVAAGSTVPAELMKKLHRVLNLTELTICYGMTETSPVSFMTKPDDPLEKRVTTVGSLLPHVKAKVVNPANKIETVNAGERGELAVSGYLVMKEYWNDPEKTAEVMVPDDDGNVWMHTGDEASMSDDGYLTITGRIKDLIIRGGENIHPLEIENCLHAHENVSDVAVIGVPDERYGEAIAAFVVPRSAAGVARDAVTEESIKDWVAKHLSRFLVPKYVFFLTDSNAFPKTGSGKIQKYLLKERALDILRRKP